MASSKGQPIPVLRVDVDGGAEKRESQLFSSQIIRDYEHDGQRLSMWRAKEDRQLVAQVTGEKHMRIPLNILYC